MGICRMTYRVSTEFNNNSSILHIIHISSTNCYKMAKLEKLHLYFTDTLYLCMASYSAGEKLVESAFGCTV
jgi:hypothetical protein